MYKVHYLLLAYHVMNNTTCMLQYNAALFTESRGF